MDNILDVNHLLNIITTLVVSFCGYYMHATAQIIKEMKHQMEEDRKILIKHITDINAHNFK